ncbi:MAG: aldehyde dehydrogenase family protein, partial [Actinomycetes bacterium]
MSTASPSASSPSAVATEGMFYDVVDPATEQVLTTVPLADVAQTDAAVARAARAYESWRHVAPADRGRLLRRFAEQVDAHGEELAQLEVRNSGHT